MVYIVHVDSDWDYTWTSVVQLNSNLYYCDSYYFILICIIQIFIILVFRYTYGKPVKGEATITAYPDIFSGVIQPIFQNPIRKVIPIDGKVTVDFDIARELK